MRLYRLLSRHGDMKGRPWPWFEPPAVGAPMKYVGWNWDPAIREWVEADVEPIRIVVDVPEYPKPAFPPGPAQPSDVPGWFWDEHTKTWIDIPLTPQELSEQVLRGPMPMYPPGPARPTSVEGWGWSETQKEWVATVIVGQSVEFTPPRTLPPGITQQAAIEMFSWDWLFEQEMNAFIAQGYTREAAFRITRENFDPLLRMLWAKQAAANKSVWKITLEHFGYDPDFVKETITVYGAAIVLAAVAGAVIGTIMERWTFVDEPKGFLPEPPGTYLMGPDEWFYSRNIGVSPMGVLYYSKCQGIGTEYTRHKRSTFGGLHDVIDFPEGFLEQGYQFPHWVKYRWSHWKIVYVGMMYSSSELVYVLKKELISLEERARPVTVRPSEEWCSGFHWYL